MNRSFQSSVGLFSLAGLGLLSLAAASQRAEAAGREDEKVIVNSIGMKLALIPEGKFQMGSPETEAERDEKETLHEVSITRPFFMGVYPVTQSQWLKVTGKATTSRFREKKGGGPDYPIENMVFDEAIDFCNRLNALPAEKQAGRTYRLPTEAEWEYALPGRDHDPLPLWKIALQQASQLQRQLSLRRG